MIQLLPADYDKVLPLINENEIKGFFSYVHSVLEGRQVGHVLVDDAEHPQTVVVMHCGGFGFVCGAVDSQLFIHDVPEFISKLNDPQWHTFWPSTPAWLKALAEISNHGHRRKVFEFPTAPPPFPPDWREDLPTGFVLRRIDETLALQMESDFSAWDIEIWGGPTQFVRDSVGFCVTLGDQIVSASTAAFIGGGALEISIMTGEDFRRRGLARLTCRALIEWSLTHNLIPNWSCFVANLASAALAESLGFINPREIIGLYLSSSFEWTDGKWRNTEAVN